MKRPFLDAYRKFARAGRLPLNGLCNSIHNIKLSLADTFVLIKPTREDYKQIDNECLCDTFWASGLPWDDDNKIFAFTPLRANILLLCACVNGEY
jgi:hypothetical protein